MGRIYSEIKTNGRKLWTLFDTGSRNTYIVSRASEGFPTGETGAPRRVGLGGSVKTFNKICTFSGDIEDKSVDITAYVIESLGSDEHGREIDLLFGSLEMQRWGIVLVPREERLDLTHYPEEFIEY